MRGNPCELPITLKQSPVMLPSPRKNNLISRHFLDEFKKGILLIEQWIRMLKQRVSRLQRALQALHCEKAVADVSCFQSNHFR